MKTLQQLESLQPLTTVQRLSVNNCMCCGASIRSSCCEIIVYRVEPNGPNLTFEQARELNECGEFVTAEVCFECNDRLYA